MDQAHLKRVRLAAEQTDLSTKQTQYHLNRKLYYANINSTKVIITLMFRIHGHHAPPEVVQLIINTLDQIAKTRITKFTVHRVTAEGFEVSTLRRFLFEVKATNTFGVPCLDENNVRLSVEYLTGERVDLQRESPLKMLTNLPNGHAILDADVVTTTSMGVALFELKVHPKLLSFKHKKRAFRICATFEGTHTTVECRSPCFKTVTQ